MRFRSPDRFPQPLFLLFMVVVLSVGQVFGQTYYARNFSVEDGLPSNVVRAVFKDSRGIMWIGTNAGLCRFDGRDFKVYNSADGLGAENIFDITEDDDGNLWIGGMSQGISRFDGKQFTNYGKKDGLVGDDVRRVWWSKRFGRLLVGANQGFSAFDGDRFISLDASKVGKEGETYFVLGFLEKEDHIDLYAYGFDKVFCYYPVSNTFTEYAYDPAERPNPSCSPVLGKHGDTIWAWTRNGIQVWNHGMKHAFDSLGQVFHMAVDGEKNIWIAAWAEAPIRPEMPGGLYVFDGKHVTRLSERFGISDPGVWTVFYDPVFQIVWVGTLHQGLFRIPMTCFEWYERSFFGLSSMQINEIYMDGTDNLWIATTRELIKKFGNGGYYIYPQKVMKAAQSKAHSKYFPLIWAYLLDKEGSFEKYKALIDSGKFPFPNPYWLVSPDLGGEKKGTAGSLYDPDAYKRIYASFKQGLNDTSAISYFGIGEDSRHNIYASGGFGTSRFMPDDAYSKPEVLPVLGVNRIFAFDTSDTLFISSSWDLGLWCCAVFPRLQYPDHYFYQSDKENAPNNPVRMISRGDEIWSASRTGGLFLTLNGRNFAFSKANTLVPRNINDICFDGPENIIAGVNSGEVLILKWAGGKLKLLYRLDSRSGIVGKSIKWVKTDRNRNLYIGSNAGLNIVGLNHLFSTGNAGVRFFSKETGYKNPNGTRAVTDKSGDLWVAVGNQLCRLDHRQLEKRQIQMAKLVLTGIEINNHYLVQRPDLPTNPWFQVPEGALSLNHDENNLIFHFDALNYLDAGQQRFRYRLMPAIDKWCSYTGERKAVFTTLSPGRYRLEVESINLLDQTQVGFLSYAFEITPPFYFTWWFFVVVAIFLSGLATLFWRLRIQQIRKEEKRKADIRLELNNIEMKALKAQMNPHFIFNAINSIQSYILSNNVDRALYYLSMFAKLVRKTLENASRESIPLCEELEYLSFYIDLEKMRFEGQFESELELDPKVPLDTTMIAPMIVQPFVENAIKHGLLKMDRVGKLKLQVKRFSETRFQVIVEDNGIGRDRAEELRRKGSKEHHSKGMSITNTRIHLLNENEQTGAYSIKIVDLLDDSDKPAGTRVELTFPME
jgi:ligand-binding sensor domain-containing protein